MNRPLDRDKRCTPLSEWPAAHRAAWQLALQPEDLFEPSTGYANKWAAATQIMVEKGYGTWLAWLRRTRRLDASGSPADHATRENVTAYLNALRADRLADYTVAGLLQQLSNALKAIAQNGDWQWIQLASSRIHSGAIPAIDRDACMQPAQDVLALGHDLMRLADEDRFRTDLDRAKMFRDGLIIALLILRPLRSANFCSITLGQHLRLHRQQWRLSFDAVETKGRAPIDCCWPDQLVGALERYVAVHRQVLAKLPDSVTTKSPAGLWISARGDQMCPDAISFQVRDRTKGTFGTAINLHSFRHIAATTIATANPEGVTDIKAVLAHSTMRTSEAHYNRAKMVDAARIYHETIHQLRQKPDAAARRAREEIS